MKKEYRKQNPHLMVKTILLVCCLISVSVTLGCCAIKSDAGEENPEETVNESIEKDQSVDSGIADEPRAIIAALDESKEYREAGFEERFQMAEKLLNDLEQKGMVRDVVYSEEDKMFTFEFEDGGLGGINLIDFDEDMNF